MRSDGKDGSCGHMVVMRQMWLLIDRPSWSPFLTLCLFKSNVRVSTLPPSSLFPHSAPFLLSPKLCVSATQISSASRGLLLFQVVRIAVLSQPLDRVIEKMENWENLSLEGSSQWTVKYTPQSYIHAALKYQTEIRNAKVKGKKSALYLWEGKLQWQLISCRIGRCCLKDAVEEDRFSLLVSLPLIELPTVPLPTLLPTIQVLIRCFHHCNQNSCIIYMLRGFLQRRQTLSQNNIFAQLCDK